MLKLVATAGRHKHLRGGVFGAVLELLMKPKVARLVPASSGY